MDPMGHETLKLYLDHAILFNEMLKVLCSGL